MSPAPFDRGVWHLCFLEAEEVKFEPPHVGNDLLTFGRFLHAPYIETAYFEASPLSELEDLYPLFGLVRVVSLV